MYKKKSNPPTKIFNQHSIYQLSFLMIMFFKEKHCVLFSFFRFVSSKTRSQTTENIEITVFGWCIPQFMVAKIMFDSTSN